jgi:8-oxo-dGTP pyrophosphatase MutT (NUDIX family)
MPKSGLKNNFYTFMWKTLSSKEIFSHPRLTLIEDEVVLPNGHNTTYLKYKENGGCGATIIAQRPDGKILLQTEYSYPSSQKLFQFPGGEVEPNESPEIGANRELMEEGKLMAHRLDLLGSFYSNHRRWTEKIFVYLATDLEQKSLPGDPEEEMEDFWFTESEITQMIKTGQIPNHYVLTAWCLYMSKK